MGSGINPLDQSEDWGQLLRSAVQVLPKLYCWRQMSRKMHAWSRCWTVHGTPHAVQSRLSSWRPRSSRSARHGYAVIWQVVPQSFEWL